MKYLIVELGDDNEIVRAVAAFRMRYVALEFLFATLERHPNRDLLEGDRFYPWEFPTVPAAAAA